MSDISITIQIISDLLPHPNADKLEIAKILGTQTLVPKGDFKVGDAVVYFPPDILLPGDVSDELGVTKYLKSTTWEGFKFPCRVAACRLRGVPSYGFCISKPAMPVDWDTSIIGKDVTEYYRAVQYEPPVRAGRSFKSDQEKQPASFHEYTDIQNFWKYHTAIPEGTPVRITEKLHGTNSRVALLEVNDEWDFFAGSHHRCLRQYATPIEQLMEEVTTKKSVYWHPFDIPGVLDLLTDLCDEEYDVILFGELFGPGVQDLDYGVPAGEIGWRCYDISINGRYLGWAQLVVYCLAHGVPTVPVIYTGPFSVSLVDVLTNGPTAMGEVNSKFKGREGIVITPLNETYSDELHGRLILKSVSADYRDRKGAKDEGEL